jgi:23S rRNA pseudouridine1911/1915/1917 synthase
MTIFHLKVSTNHQGERLDKYLAHQLTELSRSRIQALIEGGHVGIDPSRSVACSLKLRDGDTLEIRIPPLEEATPQPKAMILDILYEDEDLLVINKAAGMVVHPAPGHTDDTLVNALLAHCGDSLSGIGGVKRPGIVHRLDKETSGLMVVAKNDRTHQALTEQFQGRSLSRIYLALVWGRLSPATSTLTTQLGRHPRHRQKMAVLSRGGREAITHYRTLKNFPNGPNPDLSLTFVECQLATGRTHQIRVHLHHLGHPLLGDPTYGHTPKGASKIWPENIIHFPRQALHARSLRFIHPKTGEPVDFSVPLPRDMAEILEMLEEK